MEERTFICDNISVNEDGHLCFAGRDVLTLAAEYKTPLYLFDEKKIRENMRRYMEAFAKYYPGTARISYASKACAFKQMYRIAAEEGIGIDTVSCGEIYTAASAGFPLENAFFHGNAKTDEDIAYACGAGTGYFVADNTEELIALEAEAERLGITQKILLRITPGIDPHTYEAVSTGKVDSKFGNAIETGAAEEIVRLALSMQHIALCGYHCHVGSQVFGEDVFERAAEKMLDFAADIREKTGYVPEILNLGGGIGVRYVSSDPEVDFDGIIQRLCSRIVTCCGKSGLPLPEFIMEPGRSIAADAGMTLYTVSSVKKIEGFRNYASVDGGMTDNPRYALYGSSYTVYAAGRMNEKEEEKFTVAGRCCESGDIIQKDVPLPSGIARGDILAVCTTGAYNYSMASNYNRIGRPAVVFVNEEGSYIAVKRETLSDLAALDC